MNHFGLTAIERSVYESIQRGNSTLSQILVDTQLALTPLQAIIQTLIIKGFVTQQGKNITLNAHTSSVAESEINSAYSKKWEAKELIESFVKSQDEIKMNKIYLTKKDEVIFKALLHRLEDFIQRLPKSSISTLTAEHTVVFWGMEKYGTLIQKMMA